MSRPDSAMPIAIKYSLLAAMTTVLCACGSSSAPTTAAKRAAHAPAAKPAARGGDGSDPDLVAAVSASGTGPPISMRFRLDAKPIVGTATPLVISIFAAPGIDISHIHGSLQPAEGLLLQSGRSFDADTIREGTPLQQQVTVVPQRDGVLSLSASVEIDYADTSMTRTYVIPLIAVDSAS
jgi:hypothetical protein